VQATKYVNLKIDDEICLYNTLTLDISVKYVTENSHSHFYNAYLKTDSNGFTDKRDFILIVLCHLHAITQN